MTPREQARELFKRAETPTSREELLTLLRRASLRLAMYGGPKNQRLVSEICEALDRAEDE